MPSESELRSRMREQPSGDGEIDVARVIRRARARRLPRLLAVGGAATLAIAAVAVPVSVNLFSPGGTPFVLSEGAGGSQGDGGATEGTGAADAGSADSGATELAPMAGSVSAFALTTCGLPVPDVAPAASGLVLTVPELQAAAGARSVDTVVTLTNTGDARVRGTTPSTPTMTVADEASAGNPIAIWHTGPVVAVAMEVDLDPGESMQYPATIELVRCASEDELAETPPGGLPALEAGEYRVSAAIDLTPAGGGAIELVTGESSRLMLR